MNKIRWITRDAKQFDGDDEYRYTIALWDRKPRFMGGEWIPPEGVNMNVCIYVRPTTEIMHLLFGKDFLAPGEIGKFSHAHIRFEIVKKGGKQ